MHRHRPRSRKADPSRSYGTNSAFCHLWGDAGEADGQAVALSVRLFDVQAGPVAWASALHAAAASRGWRQARHPESKILAATLHALVIAIWRFHEHAASRQPWSSVARAARAPGDAGDGRVVHRRHGAAAAPRLTARRRFERGWSLLERRQERIARRRSGDHAARRGREQVAWDGRGVLTRPRRRRGRRDGIAGPERQPTEACRHGRIATGARRSGEEKLLQALR